MANRNFNCDELFFETLTPENCPETFDCGDEDLNEFLVQDALRHAGEGIATTTLITYKDRVVAYFALCSDAIRLTRGEKKKDTTFFYKDFPALKIARLAVCLEYKSKGVGRYLLDVILGLAQNIIQEQNVAIKYLSVDAYYMSKEFYQKYGFLINRAVDENPPTEGAGPATISMRYLIDSRAEPKVE